VYSASPAQRRAGGGRTDRAEDAGRVPALAVVMAGVAPGELGPGLVAGDIGGEHGLPRSAERLAFGEDRRDQHGRGMAAQRGDIVIVERVPGGAVDPRRLGCGRPLAGEVQSRLAAHRAQRPAQQLGCRVMSAGDHRRDRVDKADSRDICGAFGQPLEGEIGNKTAEILGQRHDDPPLIHFEPALCAGSRRAPNPGSSQPFNSAAGSEFFVSIHRDFKKALKHNWLTAALRGIRQGKIGARQRNGRGIWRPSRCRKLMTASVPLPLGHNCV